MIAGLNGGVSSSPISSVSVNLPARAYASKKYLCSLAPISPKGDFIDIYQSVVISYFAICLSIVIIANCSYWAWAISSLSNGSR